MSTPRYWRACPHCGNVCTHTEETIGLPIRCDHCQTVHIFVDGTERPKIMEQIAARERDQALLLVQNIARAARGEPLAPKDAEAVMSCIAPLVRERDTLKLQLNDATATLRGLLSEEQMKADKWRSLFERQRFIETCSPAERIVEQNAIDLAVVMLSGDTPQPPKRSTL